MRLLKGRTPSPSMVVALIALFVAMGGTGYAAITITGKNVKNSSLTGSDVKNSSLTGSDVKDNTVGSLDVKDGDLLAKDFKPGQLVAGAPGPAGPTGAQGAKGETGAKGDKGDAGQNGQDLTFTTTLKSGQTETGMYAAGSNGAGTYPTTEIEFHPHLAAGIPASNVQYLLLADTRTTECPGDRQAAAGFLCIYSHGNNAFAFVGAYRPSDTGDQGADPEGAALHFTATAGGYDRGLWAVTAP